MDKTRNSNVSKGGCMRFYLHYDDIDEAEIAENIIRSYGIKPEVTTKNIFGFYACQICIDTSLEFFDYVNQEIAKKIQKYKIQEEKRSYNIKFLESCLTKDKVKENTEIEEVKLNELTDEEREDLLSSSSASQLTNPTTKIFRLPHNSGFIVTNIPDITF